MKTGIVGWRGMVGSVLMERMRAERDFDLHRAGVLQHLAGGRRRRRTSAAARACCAMRNDLEALAACDVIVTCQGGDYTNAVHPKLRAAGWKGYWIDAASALRMKDDAVIILDPVNRDVIDARAGGGRARLHRRQLHGVADDDGARRAVPRRADRVDHLDDLPGGLGRRRAEHARAARADGRGACGGGDAAARPGQRHPRHRPRRDRLPAQRRAAAGRSSARRWRAA